MLTVDRLIKKRANHEFKNLLHLNMTQRLKQHKTLLKRARLDGQHMHAVIKANDDEQKMISQLKRSKSIQTLEKRLQKKENRIDSHSQFIMGEKKTESNTQKKESSVQTCEYLHQCQLMNEHFRCNYTHFRFLCCFIATFRLASIRALVWQSARKRVELFSLRCLMISSAQCMHFQLPTSYVSMYARVRVSMCACVCMDCIKLTRRQMYKLKEWNDAK